MEDHADPGALEWRRGQVPGRSPRPQAEADHDRSDRAVTDARVYTRTELSGLRTDVAAGRAVRCPRCSVELARRPVPPNADVAYVRRRVWWVCPECKRSAILEADGT